MFEKKRENRDLLLVVIVSITNVAGWKWNKSWWPPF